MTMNDKRPIPEPRGKRVHDNEVSHFPSYKHAKLEEFPHFLRDCHPSLAPLGDSKTFELAPISPSRLLVADNGSHRAIVNLHNAEKRSLTELEKVESSDSEKPKLPKKNSRLISHRNLSIRAPHSMKFTPTINKVVHDTAFESPHSFPYNLSPRFGVKEKSLSPFKCEVLVNGNFDFVPSTPVEKIKNFDGPEVYEEVDTCKLKKVQIGTEELGVKMATSYEKSSKQRLSRDGHKYVPVRQDTNEFLEPNSPEKKPRSVGRKAIDAVSQESENYLLVKESNKQKIGTFQVGPERMKVRKTLNLFDNLYNKLFQQCLLKPKLERSSISQIPIKAAGIVKQKVNWASMNERVIGSVPGIMIGDQFRFRAQIVLVGLHSQYRNGIDYMKKGSKNVAISIVDSGRYANTKGSDYYTREPEALDVFFYSGQGGNPLVSSSCPKGSEDQKLEGGNLALKNSMDGKIPIRVIRKLWSFQVSTTRAKSWKNQGFMYDGLYLVSNCMQERGPYGKLIYKFQFNRLHAEPEINRCLVSMSIKSKSQHHHHIVDYDISQGKEKMSVSVWNAYDKEKPPSFNYVSEMVHSKKLDEVSTFYSCDCINGCSDENPCVCLIKNGGEIPFNNNGAILERKSIVYECGPYCKCPPSCKNRVSQNGVCYQLEIFKTETKGWGVRSKNFIKSGSFVCEYVGEMLTEKEAEERTNSDYFFDIGIVHDNNVAPNESLSSTRVGLTSSKRNDQDGFTIDAAKYGNIARFINHSCSPNLFAQDVLYDHDDMRRPHIMLFASANIPPQRAFSFDYNYTIGQVRDASDNIKINDCYCGAHECIRRSY